MSGYESAADFIARISALDTDELTAMNAAAITDEMTAAVEQDAEFFAEQAALETFEQMAPLVDGFVKQRNGHPLTERETEGLAANLIEQQNMGQVMDAQRAYEQYERDSGDEAPDFSTHLGRAAYADEKWSELKRELEQQPEPESDPERPELNNDSDRAKYAAELLDRQLRDQTDSED